ncbi:hypothetical protein SETIT_9G476800v2 [Setaria italica]|uniref:Uncharacterized protein n=1 Tax=Setaria italica TaxID=4555 RepID=K4AMN4_SETIT|nr:hypothetical protein SETIT_9G476800v2 [Setaria italica]
MAILVLSEALPLIFTSPHVWLGWIDTISSHNIMFFVGLYMVAIGYGGQNPCIISFGADQFDDTDEKEKAQKSSFFNRHYFHTKCCFPDIRDYYCVGAFFLGHTMYRFQKQGGSPVARVCQVIVAATRNFNEELPCDPALLYEIPGQGSAIEGSRKLEHTTGLEFFDKAAIVTTSDVESVSLLTTRRICTVTQVEETGTMILFNTVLEQMFSTFVEQEMIMDKHIGFFEIPPASFQSVVFYERILVPVFRKYTGTANGITPLQRIGIGLILSMLSMVSAALVESNRVHIAEAEGLVHQKVAVPMSILWQGPQYFLIGAGEVFSKIGLNGFFYGESSDAMRSLCLAFSLANISAGSYLSSFIISLVPAFKARGGNPGWIPDNLNEVDLDRFYWMMTGLCSLNLLAFVFCAMRAS